jgi:nucleoside-diphosphate-sugar epimerase
VKVRWITPLLGTAAAADIEGLTGVCIVDVRDLVDKAGNDQDAVRAKIRQGVDGVARGVKTIVCCDYGTSRSNAVATGILASSEGYSFEAALRQVQERTGETEIKLEPLKAVRAALGLGSEPRRAVASRAVLVTGASGFLGRSLVPSLGDESRVVAPTRSQLDVALGSTQLDMLASDHDVGCVVHLGNPRVYTSNAAIGQTLTMLRNVIDVCLARDICLIYPSSWEVYSGYAGTMCADESTSPLPRGPYGESKYLAEKLIDHARKSAGLRCGVLRSSPVYGCGGNKPRFLYNFIEKALRSMPIVTHRYRTGPPALDLLYVDDVVSALVKMVGTSFDGALNIGTGILTTTLRIAEMVTGRLGSGSTIEQISLDADFASVSMDWRRAHQQLGWKPTVSLDIGLDRILSEINTTSNDTDK